MRKSTILLLIAAMSAVHHGGASQKKVGRNEELNVSGSGEKEDEKLLEEHKDTSQTTDAQHKNGEFEDETGTNTPQGAKQQGKSVSRPERALPALAATVLKNPKVQEAVVDKGLEVMNKLVDKQLRIIDEAQEKASNFLAKEIKLDIMPDKGWSTPDMFVPPGYHMGATLSGVEKSEKEQGDVPYTYAPNTGVGYVMMNGCWGTNYTASDPCYNAKWTSSVCQNMIDGAAFLGVGFDGRGEYSPESRKMSIVQRNCKNKATYDDFHVPDTMNVHGIYDTSATMHTFESRAEFQTYLQQEAGVSGSYFGFYAGAKKAWGSSSSAAGQQFMSVLDVDVDRYEIFMDEVRPEDLSSAFLREFINLPKSYFDAGAPIKFQNFIQRWGTHYIKSARFGGQLEIRKRMDAKDAGTKTQFSQKMELEYKSLFASVGAKYEKKGGTSFRQQTKTTSTEVEAKGGSQDIASILSDVYSPTFKTEFKEWLQSIPRYPKAYKFLMGSITELVNFRANDLFPSEKVNWGCEGKAAELETEKDGGKFYYTYPIKGKKKKIYCEYDSRQSLETAIMEKRTSLKRAIEIYMEEGPVSLSDVRLEKCPSKKSTTNPPKKSVSGDKWMDQKEAPRWDEMTSGESSFQVTFDMLDDLINPLHSALSIKKNMKRNVRYRNGKWYTSDDKNTFHLYSGFASETSDIRKHKMSILGLRLSYNEKEGTLFLDDQDYSASKKVFYSLPNDLKGISLASVEHVIGTNLGKRNLNPTTKPPTSGIPCHAEWSNILRIDLEDMQGKCLHFTAASSGTFYVVFSASPKNLVARYVVEISQAKVVIFKGNTASPSSKTTATVTSVDAVAIGESVLFESYFVCITISGQNTLIEYGKNIGTKDGGNVYLNMIDNKRNFDIRFYAFGNKDDPVNIMDAHIVSHNQTKVQCKGDTVKDAIGNMCAKSCHRHCDPVAGCTAPHDATKCQKCRVVKMPGVTPKCVHECPKDFMTNKNKECVASYDLRANLAGQRSKKRASVGGELSICLWVKLEEVLQSGSTPSFNLFQITSGHDSSMRITLKTDGGQLILEFAYGLGIGPLRKRRNVNVLTDKKWHQVCVLLSSKTTAWSIYLDGKRDNIYGTYDRFSGGRKDSKLHVADSGGFWPQKLLITQLNLWDRVLTGQEIETFAETCNQGIGDLVSWSDLYDNTQTRTYIKPSTCQAIPTALSSVATPVTTKPKTDSTTSQTVTTKSSGK